MSGVSPKTKVLVVDDDTTLLGMYKERLEASGYDVVIASNGEDALKTVGEFNPDCMLLDVMMPRMSGYDVLQHIKADEKTKDIPVIMLTALVQDASKQKSIAEGADSYLIKSEIMPGEVINKIEETISKKRN
jgi:CheY-like chemotaxis protein